MDPWRLTLPAAADAAAALAAALSCELQQH